ncbi:ABC transporter substrate-binding protein [Paenibacillus glycanilyticus]|uniref:ABC transporter substrate-binding protein n=1 Tax=Paenibacillus glycanilyticus TaxID=126569 RepID=A0ABQ6G9D8_9BACL|nr:ABC transporter substrate-binding protein [Paenibacillus glycanilyticus]GLX67579.1 ABC transporter substrate-binding protein [Paenibacillus glycanilyticus]
MKKAGKWMSLLIATMLTMGALSACGEQANNTADQAKEAEKTGNNSGVETVEPDSGDAEPAAATQLFQDWTGHSVEVPTLPKRIIFHGETTGDLAALGVNPVGIMQSSVDGTLSKEHFKDAQDIGFPFNVEKALDLTPDLIIFGNADEEQYVQISKVAPTVTFDTFGSLDERLTKLGQLLGKQEEAGQWLESYHAKEAAMWKAIRDGGIGENVTATVFTMYPGDRLFAMANTGLSQILYDEGGMKPTPLVQEALDAGQGFVEISLEKLSEYAGDYIFLLTPVDAEAVSDTEELKKSKVWNGLDAVKNGKVYTFGLLEAYSDAMSRDWLLDQLPKALLKSE